MTKAKQKQFNIPTLEKDIDNIFIDFFNRYNIDIYDIQQCKTIPHNIMTLCLLEVYNTLFKPSTTLIYNRKSLLDYNDINLLTAVANKFIEWSLRFNKSLGLMQFSIMTGIHRVTLAEWRDHPEANPAQSDLIKNICECHKMEQINLLNDTPVGALSVANNDSETGLQWSQNQMQQITNNTVYLLPSERENKLGLKAPED